PGLYSLWAHAHDGGVARASLVPESRRVLSSLSREKSFLKLFVATSDADDAVYDWLRPALDADKITAEEAPVSQGDLTNQVLARAGVIDYRSNHNSSGVIARLKLAPHLDDAASQVARSFFDEPTRNAISAHDRSSEPLRHPGDVGTSFDRNRE